MKISVITVAYNAAATIAAIELATAAVLDGEAAALVLDDVDGAGVGAGDGAGVAEDELEDAPGVALAIEGEADVDQLIGDAALQHGLRGADALFDGASQERWWGRERHGVDAMGGQPGQRGREGVDGAAEDHDVEAVGRRSPGLDDGKAGAVTHEQRTTWSARGPGHELQAAELRAAPDLGP